MELVTGALPRLLAKLADLLTSEYKLHKGVKGGIMFLKVELESMQVALEKISETPPGQLDKQDKIWARDVRELSYDIEDCIDTAMVRSRKNSEPVGVHGFKVFIHRCCEFVAQFKIRRNIATEIRSIKRCVLEVCERRHRYRIDSLVVKPITVTIDPRLLAQFKQATELVGIEAARDDLINILMEGDDVFMVCAKTVSIVGFGGLGKTTLAKAVYDNIGAQFDCRAFVSVSQTPNMVKLFKSLLYELSNIINDDTLDERWLINELQEFLQKKRYFIVFDDIWDISVWKDIRCALPDSYGHRILITTRIFDVAKLIGGCYKMKPLSIEDSRKLLYKRIFGSEEKDNKQYLAEELAEVSHTVLKKCAGVPLAIITLASLLASKRSKMEWYKVCNSIGTGLENTLDLENMRKILSFSYYDLPYNLRTCLLYLSVFPEDYKISKDCLIRMWIAEGFIQCENQNKSLFELGESYFHELINRSMIQPVYTKYSMVIEQCCLHDMVLDLIRSLSNEENFINIMNDVHHTSQPHKARRLCVQYGRVDLATSQATRSLHQVRSLVLFHSTLGQMAALGKFRVLRVLDLPGCDLSQGCSLKYLGKLIHLRYLGLRCTRIAQLPKAIRNLVFLQTLDVTANHNLRRLPTSVVRLRNLISLHIDRWVEVPRRIGKLTSLEQLSRFGINDSEKNIEELGHLTELRELCIFCSTGWNECLEKSLMECLSKLQKIQTLSFRVSDGRGNLDAWVAPRHLSKLDLTGCWFSALPGWIKMNPMFLLDLSFLCISVRKLQQEDLEILGKLPALCYLNLKLDSGNLKIHRGFFIGPYSFPCLVQCLLREFGGPVVFKHGAMPRLTTLELTFPMCTPRQITGMGLWNLPALQDVAIYLNNVGSSKIEAEAALRHAAEIHPNHPTIEINYQRRCRLKID